MIKVVGIKFINGNRIYYFSPNKLNINSGDYVIVETEKGIQMGISVTDIVEMDESKIFLPLKEVIRVATKDDLNKNIENQKAAEKALIYARKIVEKEKLDMKLYETTYTFDRKKLIFKFIADERVDFRELAKILAAKYKTRIELRQIGVRDKSKEIGGLGPCGRLLCCNQFLSSFETVSINMAKNQSIALNPTKINGACGRLLCCLGYEDDTYTEYKKDLPKLGQIINYNKSKVKVIELDVLNRKIKVKDEDGTEFYIEVKDGSYK